MNVKVLEDLEQCRRIWQEMMPRRSVFDLWAIRACFQRQYGYWPRFLVAEDRGRVRGLVALSKISECGYWGCFPGETWHGKTWLEQNRIVADSLETYRRLLEACPPNTYLRYLRPQAALPGLAIDGVERRALEFPHCLEIPQEDLVEKLQRSG